MLIHGISEGPTIQVVMKILVTMDKMHIKALIAASMEGVQLLVPTLSALHNLRRLLQVQTIPATGMFKYYFSY